MGATYSKSEVANSVTLVDSCYCGIILPFGKVTFVYFNRRLWLALLPPESSVNEVTVIMDSTKLTCLSALISNNLLVIVADKLSYSKWTHPSIQPL